MTGAAGDTAAAGGIRRSAVGIVAAAAGSRRLGAGTQSRQVRGSRQEEEGFGKGSRGPVDTPLGRSAGLLQGGGGGASGGVSARSINVELDGELRGEFEVGGMGRTKKTSRPVLFPRKQEVPAIWSVGTWGGGGIIY